MNELKSLKEIRRDLHQALNRLNRLKKSREASIVITKTEESLMWVGKLTEDIENTSEPSPSYSPSFS